MGEKSTDEERNGGRGREREKGEERFLSSWAMFNMHRQHLPPTHLFSLRLIFHFSLRSVEICSIFVSTSRQRAGEPSRSSINRQMTLTFSEGLRHCSGCVASVERIWRERERRERGGREREGRKEGEKKRRRRRNRSMVCWCGQRVHV